ncbi:FAD-binding oxidoreductase [Flammeovirga sp. EKP202]|uniref:NAD(P)/FAD-dependent oxidoreductase n=1 Tax=Flammeovirga sp. EKP202 TaxID=2770592 RepID=UPI00165FB9AA|nr:FAD-dependent oxidoreductase [Flammeovirga sp. EKP202]MBD0401089.1 FAD-binding oxidoreductase [Flammeovirga sp. EKP202]
MISYWEKESFVNYDFIVVGSGIVGLTAAIEYKEAHPKEKVLIIEKGILPSGASTKNAGIACFGSLTEICDDLENIPSSKVLETIENRYRGLQKLRNRLGDKNFDFQQLGGYELITDQQKDYLDRTSEINKMLYPIFNDNVFSTANEKIGSFGFRHQTVKHLLFNQFEGQIHTGKMMKGLIDLARSIDIEIITGTEVIDFIDDGDRVIINCKNQFQKVDFYAEKISICVNAYAKKLLPQLEVSPGRGQVLMTNPIKNLPIKGTFHMDRGYYYFRNVGNRILLGGGRNLDYEGETTTTIKTSPHIINHLKLLLKEVILPNTPHQINMTWAGIMAFGDQKVPIVKLLSDRIAIGVRMGGMGVAIGSEVGKEINSLLD